MDQPAKDEASSAMPVAASFEDADLENVLAEQKGESAKGRQSGVLPSWLRSTATTAVTAAHVAVLGGFIWFAAETPRCIKCWRRLIRRRRQADISAAASRSDLIWRDELLGCIRASQPSNPPASDLDRAVSI